MSFIGARAGWELQRLEAEAELRRAKEAAELASRSKSEFLANMSHELKTPLNAMIGFSQIIAQQMLGPIGRAEYASYARDIHDSSQNLLAIINDILDVSKLGAGTMSLHVGEIDPAQALASCCRLVQARADAAGVTLSADVPPQPLTILADERVVKQILLNLLSNAVKFTPSGGRVAAKVEAAATGGTVFTIADTGIGIAPEHLEAVFQPFAQVDASMARRADGAGLGLSLSRGLAELHGGQLTLQSQVGKGTTVRVELPLRPPHS